MTDRRSLEEILDAQPKQTDEEVRRIEVSNTAARNQKQLRSYLWAAVSTLLITAGFWVMTATQTQTVLSLVIGGSLGLLLRYAAKHGYHGHQPHIAILMLICLLVLVMSIAWFLILFI